MISRGFAMKNDAFLVRSLGHGPALFISDGSDDGGLHSRGRHGSIYGFHFTQN
jgi:hypothetical protein